MRARTVNEAIDFQRGRDVKNTVLNHYKIGDFLKSKNGSLIAIVSLDENKDKKIINIGYTYEREEGPDLRFQELAGLLYTKYEDRDMYEYASDSDIKAYKTYIKEMPYFYAYLKDNVSYIAGLNETIDFQRGGDIKTKVFGLKVGQIVMLDRARIKKSMTHPLYFIYHIEDNKAQIEQLADIFKIPTQNDTFDYEVYTTRGLGRTVANLDKLHIPDPEFIQVIEDWMETYDGKGQIGDKEKEGTYKGQNLKIKL